MLLALAVERFRNHVCVHMILGPDPPGVRPTALIDRQ